MAEGGDLRVSVISHGRRGGLCGPGGRGLVGRGLVLDLEEVVADVVDTRKLLQTVYLLDDELEDA